MGVVLHWFLPTNGDSRTDLSLGNAVGAAGSRATGDSAGDGSERAPDIGYIGQIARSAEQVGFTGALTPTSSWCEDAWIMTAGLTQVTERLAFLVAFRPGLMSPTLAAQVAERIAEYYALGIDEFILSGYPHLEEVYQAGEGLVPELRRRGLMTSPHDDN